MSAFRIFETAQFQEDLERDFRGQQTKIRSKLGVFVYPQLILNPYYGKNIKKLRGYHPETWRYRIGAFRFFYEIDDKKKIIFMISADNRSEAY